MTSAARHFLTGPVIALLALGLGLERAATGAEVRGQLVEQTRELRNDGRLVLETFSGSLRITGWERELVEIKARVLAPDDLDEDDALRSVEATRVEILGDEHSVTVRSDYDDVPATRRGWFGEERVLPQVQYELRVPHRLKLYISDHKSAIQLSGLSGHFEIDTHKGELAASALEGRLEVDTHKGSVAVTGFKGSFDIETHTGALSIEATELEGNSRLETFKGPATIRLPRTQKLDLYIETGRGTLQDELAGLTPATTSEGITRILNGGGPSLRLVTHKGALQLLATK